MRQSYSGATWWLGAAGAIREAELCASVRECARRSGAVRNMYVDDNQNDTRPRVVIVGAGFGGLEAARALRHAPVQITVIDQTNHHVFQPLRYQVATAELSPGASAHQFTACCATRTTSRCFWAKVTGVDVARRVVDEIGHREVPYDLLVLAAGAGQSYFGHDEWAHHAPGLTTISDATAIRQHILLAFEAAEMERDSEAQRVLMTLVVVGGGSTGVELARKALRADVWHIDPTSAQVVLVEVLGRILPTFSPHLAKRAARMLARLSVTVRTWAPVEHVDAGGVVIAGHRLAVRTVIWAVGVHASPAGTWLGAAMSRAGRVQVAADLHVPNHPDIFVIGDTASVRQDRHPATVPRRSPSREAGMWRGPVRRARPPLCLRDPSAITTVARWRRSGAHMRSAPSAMSN